MRTGFSIPAAAPARRVLAALAAALAVSVAGVPAAWCQTTSGTASAMAPAAQAPAHHPPATESSACRKAKSKIAREQRSIDKVQHAIDRAQDDSKKCTTKPVCDRYVTKIEELDSRRAHHAARLAKLKAAGESACGPT